MNRVTAIILGLLLFGLGVFLGMVGSFYRGLMPGTETRPTKQRATPSKPTASVAKPGTAAVRLRTGQAGAPMNGGASALPPQAVEAELNQALALLNSLLSSQAEPSESPLPTATTDTSTNAPPAPAPTETVPQPAATMTEPAVPETPPDATPVATTNAATGHWVFDPATGWVWEPEAGAPVATAPVVEVYPGGWVTIHSRPRPAGSPGTLMKKGAMRPSQMKKK